MLDLIAQGPQPRQRWRRALPSISDAAEPSHQGLASSEEQTVEVVLGRAGVEPWDVSWDDRVSRQHVRLTPQADGRVRVEKLATARNPVFYRGQRQDAFELHPGEHFVIGHTTFTLAARPEADLAEHTSAVTEHVFNVSELRGRGFRDAASRIDALGRLPDIIGGSASDDELLVRVVSLLLQSIPSAAAVAILDTSGPGSQPPRVLHYDHRIADSQGPRPSATMARQAASTQQSVLHLWAGDAPRSSCDDDPNSSGAAAAVEPLFTIGEGVDWAFSVPLPTAACSGWVIYVTGQLAPRPASRADFGKRASPEDLRDDVKFAELVGTTLGNLRQSRQLQRQQLGMQRFFAPVVMQALAGRDPEEVLQPRETDVSVIFCDLRGFTSQSEQAQGALLKLLQRVSDALGVMTGEILRHGGVVGDFHGDAAMGFWGWPLDQDDAAGRAARAALNIRDAFYHRKAVGPLGFRCGIGIATGRAVVGRIGTTDQVKVTAFGPVVNLASRLEGMTKLLGGDVLVDQTSAQWIREHLPQDQIRVRRLIRCRPAGLTTPLDVYQLLTAAGVGDAPSEEDVANYERALKSMIRGDWEEAIEYLHQVSATDRAKDFLTATILSHGRVAPPGWDGVVDIGKSP